MPVGGKRKAESAMSQKDKARAKRRARWVSESEKTRSTATKVDSPVEFGRAGQHHNRLWRSVFEIDPKYVPIKAIGEGAYGVVCSATNPQTGEKVAIKKIAHAFSHPEEAKRMLREIVLLRHLVHENIIPIKDIMKPAAKHGFSDVCVIYELMDTDLYRVISSSQNLTEDHCQYFMYQLLRGLKYVHSANVLHRDLKPSNLLVNADCSLKIGDFGLARTGSDAGHLMTEYVVTRWYRAPEVLLSSGEYSSAIDMWSVGCIFAELLGRRPLFPGKGYLDQLKLIINILGSPDENDVQFITNANARSFIQSLPFQRGVPLEQLYPDANPLALNLIDRLLEFNPEKRISVNDALEHPYLAELRDDTLEPSAPAPLHFDFEDELLDEGATREKVWDEILFYHPEAVNKVE